MSSINKLKNTWVSNDTTNLQGTYSKVSILNEGKTELKGDTLINSKLAINKNIDSVNDYKLDVSGNVNFTGSLYQNGALFTSGITQAFADGRYSQLAGANTFTGSNTFSNDLIQTNKNIIQKGLLSNNNSYSWNFGDSQVILLTLGTAITFNLPSVNSTENLGTMIYIIKEKGSQLTINASSGFTFSDETNADVSTKTYVAQSRVFVFVAMKTTGSEWKLINCMNLNTNLNFDWTGAHTFSQLPTSTVTPSTGSQLITKVFADGAYQPQSGMSSYLTTASASSTYQTQSGMSSYLTTASASSTYQTQSGMSSYLTTASASSTYQTQSGMSSYLTTASASSTYLTQSNASLTYQTIAGMSSYISLSANNVFTGTNQFNKGILPCTTWSTTNIQVGGLNTMANRQTSSLDNVGIGVDTLKGDANSAGYSFSTGSRNTAIGNYALMQHGSGNDCIAIGYQAMQLTGLERVYGAGVSPNRCIAIGGGSQKINLYGSDNISIGYNSLNTVGSGTGNIICGNNCGNALGDTGSNVVIGNSAGTTFNDNGIVCIGAGALQFATGQVNSGTFLGSNSGRYLNNAPSNTMIGAYSGQSIVSGGSNTHIGVYAGGNGTPSNVSYTILFGYDCQATQSNECVFGGSSFAQRAELTLPNKTRLACNQSPTGATINLTFRTNENIVLRDSATTTINLPTPNIDGRNVGCKFYLTRATTTAGLTITINAPSGQTIGIPQNDGTLTTATSYKLPTSISDVELLCIDSGATGTNWRISSSSFLSRYNRSMVNPTYINSGTSGGTYNFPSGGPFYEYNMVDHNSIALGHIYIKLPASADVLPGMSLRFRRVSYTNGPSSFVYLSANTNQSIIQQGLISTTTGNAVLCSGSIVEGSVLYLGSNQWVIMN